MLILIGINYLYNCFSFSFSVYFLCQTKDLPSNCLQVTCLGDYHVLRDLSNCQCHKTWRNYNFLDLEELRTENEWSLLEMVELYDNGNLWYGVKDEIFELYDVRNKNQDPVLQASILETDWNEIYDENKRRWTMTTKKNIHEKEGNGSKNPEKNPVKVKRSATHSEIIKNIISGKDEREIKGGNYIFEKNNENVSVRTIGEIMKKNTTETESEVSVVDQCSNSNECLPANGVTILLKDSKIKYHNDFRTYDLNRQLPDDQHDLNRQLPDEQHSLKITKRQNDDPETGCRFLDKIFGEGVTLSKVADHCLHIVCLAELRIWVVLNLLHCECSTQGK